MNTVDPPVHFEGQCPFLRCLVAEPHDHPVCECGAVWSTVDEGCGRCKLHAKVNEYMDAKQAAERAVTYLPGKDTPQ